MTNGYKKLITDRIKESINTWIDDLKQKQPDLLLTKQWRVIWLKGYSPGHISLPVVTHSKEGRYLIAEIQFVLPDDLEFDLEGIQLVLKNEPYSETEQQTTKSNGPAPLDEPLDVLNELVVGVNSFLQSLNVNIPQTQPVMTFFNTQSTKPNGQQTTLNVRPFPNSCFQSPSINIHPTDKVESIKQQMLKSPQFPEWMATIHSKSVFEELMEKLAEGYLHYESQMGRPVELKRFFDMYTEHLKSKGKLYPFCKYKNQPITLDGKGYCQDDSYCSKRPWNSQCQMTTYKFGNPP